jgi:hypothetical protein
VIAFIEENGGGGAATKATPEEELGCEGEYDPYLTMAAARAGFPRRLRAKSGFPEFTLG